MPITRKQGDKIFAYLADIDLLVFEYTQDFRNISVQANKLIGFGSV